MVEVYLVDSTMFLKGLIYTIPRYESGVYFAELSVMQVYHSLCIVTRMTYSLDKRVIDTNY